MPSNFSILTKMFKKRSNPLKYKFIYGKSGEKKFKPSTGFHRFSKRETLLPSRLKRVTVKLFFLILITLGIYAIFFSGYFKIKTITTNTGNFENEKLTSEIKQSISSSLGKNIFFVDLKKLEKNLIQDFSELETIKISKNYPESLSINFNEYALVANIVNYSNNVKKNYIINSIGFVNKEDFENPALPYIAIESDEPINTQSVIIEKTKLSYILETMIYFKDKFGMKVKEVNYKPTARELHLLTEKNFWIWLDIQTPYEEQFKKLKKSLVKLDIYKENLSYIDLRIAGNTGDKIIYKRK